MNYNYYDKFNTFDGLDNILPNDFINNINSDLSDKKFKTNNFNNMGVNVNSLNLYEPLEGYARGNLFKDLYDPYKNYRPQRININSEKEELLTSIGEYSFAAHELNLYLDVNPNNQNALNLFNKYREKANELMMKYERKYGPLNVGSHDDMKIPFNWEADCWPWEV